MKYVKGKATVEVKAPKGRRLIGQCKDCRWFNYSDSYKNNLKGFCHKNVEDRNVSTEFALVKNTFGCWYWKVKDEKEDKGGAIK